MERWLGYTPRLIPDFFPLWLLPSCVHASYCLVKGSWLQTFLYSKGIYKHNNLCQCLGGLALATLVALPCDPYLEKSSMIVCWSEADIKTMARPGWISCEEPQLLLRYRNSVSQTHRVLAPSWSCWCLLLYCTHMNHHVQFTWSTLQTPIIMLHCGCIFIQHLLSDFLLFSCCEKITYPCCKALMSKASLVC